MSKLITGRSIRPRFMDAGSLASLVDAFVREVASLGYSPLTVANYADPARHIATWLRTVDIDLSTVDDALVDRFARHACRCGGTRRCDRVSRRYVKRARRFVAFLADRGLVPPLPAAVVAVDANIADYQQWLKQHRGIRDSTVRRHGQMLMRLQATLGRDPSSYDAGRVRCAILAEAQ